MLTTLSEEDMAELLPIFLVINLAGNPELTVEQAAKAIINTIDRHLANDLTNQA